MHKEKKRDIVSEGLDLYFDSQIRNMSERQILDMPKNLPFRVYRNSQGNLVKTGKISFADKVSILWKVFKKDIFIAIRDNEDGIVASDFETNEKELKSKHYGESEVRDFLAKGRFVLAADDICNGLYAEHLIGASSMFKYVAAHRGQPKTSWEKAKVGIAEISRMILTYEGNKNKMFKSLTTNITEWYVLLHLADGKEKQGVMLYNPMYFDALNAKRNLMLRAFKKLKIDGYIVKIGGRKTATYQITPLGKDLVYNILSTYVLNF